MIKSIVSLKRQVGGMSRKDDDIERNDEFVLSRLGWLC